MSVSSALLAIALLASAGGISFTSLTKIGKNYPPQTWWMTFDRYRVNLPETVDVRRLVVGIEAKKRTGSVPKSESVANAVNGIQILLEKTHRTVDGIGLDMPGLYAINDILLQDGDIFAVRLKTNEKNRSLDQFRVTLCFDGKAKLCNGESSEMYSLESGEPLPVPKDATGKWFTVRMKRQ